MICVTTIIAKVLIQSSYTQPYAMRTDWYMYYAAFLLSVRFDITQKVRQIMEKVTRCVVDKTSYFEVHYKVMKWLFTAVL